MNLIWRMMEKVKDLRIREMKDLKVIELKY